jgi:hypothetical protein
MTGEPSPQTRQRQADDAKTDEQFLAEYESKHGPEAARIIAKTMGITPRRRNRPAFRVGEKEQPLPALTKVNYPVAAHGVSWTELKLQFGPRVTILYAHRSNVWELPCSTCGHQLGRGEFVKIEGRRSPNSTERFHSQCVPTDVGESDRARSQPGQAAGRAGKHAADASPQTADIADPRSPSPGRSA